MDDQITTQDAADEIEFTDAESVQGVDLKEPFSWQAPEGVQAPRGTVWYIIFAITALGLMALAIFVFKSITFAILLAIIVVAVLVLSNKAPQMINYGISPKGIYIGDKLYDFSEFRAFGVIQEPGRMSIIVLPVKRFSTGLTLYFGEEDGERIVDMLGARLPIEEVKPDALEKLIRIIRL